MDKSSEVVVNDMESMVQETIQLEGINSEDLDSIDLSEKA